MLRLHLFPASDGDCMVLEWGSPAAPHRMLVDGGRAGAYKPLKIWLDALPAAQRRFELFVVTHVDADHIAGALKLVQDPALPVTFDDVWFNAYHHLVEAESYEAFSAEQGEQLSDALKRLAWPWNRHFDGKAVMIRDAAQLRPILLTGDMTLTLLSPSPPKLQALAPIWNEAIAQESVARGAAERPVDSPAGYESFGVLNVDQLADSLDEDDTTVPNGSSIAFLSEHDGKRLLLGADAHPDLLVRSLDTLVRARTGETGRQPLDLFKTAHHGSKANLTRAVVASVDCTRFVFSTSGARWKHPDPESIARILKWGEPRVERQLYFNYSQPQTTLWDNSTLCRRYGYACSFPEEGSDGFITIDV